VFFLDDPDPFVQSEVRKRLFELGEQAVPLLDQHKSEVADAQDRDVINEIIRWITYSSVEEDFTDVLSGGLNTLKQLEEAVFILARFDNPTLRIREYQQKLDQFAEMIEPDIRYALFQTQKMHQLLDLVFTGLEFRGSTQDYYHP